MADSPVALIYGFNGTSYIETTIRAGIAIPTGQPGIIALGSDGTNARYIKVSATGVVSVDGSAVTQPVSGTVTANQGGTWNINNISGTISLPTGASTETTLAAISGKLPTSLVGGRLDTNVGSWLGSTAPTVGQKTMANSVPIVIASDQTAIPVSQSGSWTVTANAGTNLNTSALALDATLTAQSMVDNAGFTDGTTRIVPAGFILDEVAGTALTENDGAAARIDSKRAIINVIEDATTRGTRATVKAASTAAVATDPALVVTLSPNYPTGSIANGAETAVAGSAVQILAANANRHSAIIQNTGVANIRVGITGVTTTTGLRLIPGAILIFDQPFVPTNAFFAIREGAVSSIAFAQEVT